MTSITPHTIQLAVREVAASAAITLLVLYLMQPFADRFGLLDRPAGRKDHAVPTASTGGFAMLVGIVISLACFTPWTHQTIAFIVAAGLLVIVGMLDDRFDLRWWLRIIAQCAAVMVMVYGGLRVEHVGAIAGLHSSGLGLGSLSIPFTIFATVGVINAINMSDGVDGLAGGIVLAAFCMLGAAAFYAGNVVLVERVIIFMGAVFGFLLMNMRFPWQQRARVFMGNAGSALLGFMVAWVSFRLTQAHHHPVTPILAPWLVATPLIDCVTLIARRLMRHQSPFRADREHMHHLMLDAGFSPTQLMITMVTINLLLGLAAGIALRCKVPQPLLVAIFIALCLGYFWLSARRERAVAAFAWLNAGMTRLRLMPKAGLASQVSGGEE